MSDAETQPTDPTAPEPVPGEPPPEEAPPEKTDEAPEPEPGGEEETTDEGGGTDETPPPEAKGKHKRGGGFQRKIEQLERQNQLLVEQLSRNQPAPTAPAGKEKSPEEKASDYIEGIVEQRLSRREQERQAQTAVAEFQKRTAAVRATRPDFDEVLESIAHIPVPLALNQALLTSESGPEIMYQLASNPAELARVSALPPLDAAREIGRLEAKLASVTPPARKTNGVVPRPSAAPAPITPVTARGTSNVKPVEQMSYEEYRAWRDSPRKR